MIDEAGQVSLADALAMGTAARNVVLLGDPLQLAQVSQGTHPAGTGASVLEHLLGDEATVLPHMGLFLERTRRMHPDVCRFISEIVYGGRLQGIPGARAADDGVRHGPALQAGRARGERRGIIGGGGRRRRRDRGDGRRARGPIATA